MSDGLDCMRGDRELGGGKGRMKDMRYVGTGSFFEYRAGSRVSKTSGEFGGANECSCLV